MAETFAEKFGIEAAKKAYKGYDWYNFDEITGEKFISSAKDALTNLTDIAAIFPNPSISLFAEELRQASLIDKRKLDQKIIFRGSDVLTTLQAILQTGNGKKVYPLSKAYISTLKDYTPGKPGLLECEPKTGAQLIEAIGQVQHMIAQLDRNDGITSRGDVKRSLAVVAQK